MIHFCGKRCHGLMNPGQINTELIEQIDTHFTITAFAASYAKLRAQRSSDEDVDTT